MVDSDQIILELRDVSFRYAESQNKVISDLDLNIEKGEFIVITGRSGSGKSTLAYILSGFIPHLIAGEFQGEVEYQGIKTQTLTLGEISQFIGLVQQDPENQIVTSSVLEEIAFGPENLNLNEEEIKKRLEFSISATNLEDLVRRGTNELSGGEKQRVALASVLTMGGSILILDEPTSYLDQVNKIQVLKFLQQLNSQEQMTIIVIDHQPEIYKDLLNRLIVLEKGVITSDWSKEEIDYSKFRIPESSLKHIKNITSVISEEKILETRDYEVFINNKQILFGITSSINSGLIYGIIGRNGSGKTTFANALLNLQAKRGRLSVFGEDSTKKPTYELARNCGLVYQNPNHQIFEQSVEKEVSFAPKNLHLASEIIDQKIDQLLRSASLQQYRTFPPYGLSFGEKRRLTVISVDIYSPAILVMDEPFIGQDKENFEFILNIIQLRKKNGLTTVLISHRQELLSLVDRLLIFEKGKMIAEGNVEELLPIIQEKQLCTPVLEE